MPTIPLDAENAVDQLLEIAKPLPDDKLDTRTSLVFMLNAERKYPHLSSEETLNRKGVVNLRRLLCLINEHPPTFE